MPVLTGIIPSEILNNSIKIPLLGLGVSGDITRMAKKYKKTPEQILLRYQIDKGNISVVELNSKSALMSNLEAFKFELKKSDIAEMELLDRQQPFI